jgi:hypothetical protein
VSRDDSTEWTSVFDQPLLERGAPPLCRDVLRALDQIKNPETAIARPELRALAERFGVMMQELLEALAYLAKRGYLRPERRSGKSPAYRLSVEPAGQMSPPSSARRPTSTTSLLVFPPARRPVANVIIRPLINWAGASRRRFVWNQGAICALPLQRSSWSKLHAVSSSDHPCHARFHRAGAVSGAEPR